MEIVRGGEFVRICGRSKPLPYRGGMEFVRGGEFAGICEIYDGRENCLPKTKKPSYEGFDTKLQIY